MNGPDTDQAREAFFALSERLSAELRGGESLFCELSGEQSDFVRLNRARIRQAGRVARATLSLTLIEDARQAVAGCDISGDLARDFEQARALLRQLRQRLRHLPDDPYLQFCRQASVSDQAAETPAIDAGAALREIIAAAEGLDLVGIWASGDLTAGLASSVGHRHWHGSRSFHFDWSCHGQGELAVKASQGGVRFDPDPIRTRLAEMRAELDMLARPAKTLPPGRYRAWLAPTAVAELIDMLAWDAFELKCQRTRQTPLLQLLDGVSRFDPRLTLRECHGAAGTGLLPSFTSEGFLRPDVVTLIDAGAPGAPLVDARAGKEFGEAVNSASGYPESISMAPGDLPQGRVLEHLGTGLLIGHLWYCNWSDENCCRLTGMTRFGTYWVEQGEIVAPVAPMRFDDSLYGLLGDRLIAIGAETQLMLSASTYEGRSHESARLPGVLVEDLELAL